MKQSSKDINNSTRKTSPSEGLNAKVMAFKTCFNASAVNSFLVLKCSSSSFKL